MKLENTEKALELIEELELYKDKIEEANKLKPEALTLLRLEDYNTVFNIRKSSICEVIYKALVNEIESQIKSIESQISKL